MELTRKIREDIKKIDLIENPFHRNLVALVYNPNVTHELIPTEMNYNLPPGKSLSGLIKWLETVERVPVPTFESHLPLGKYAEELILYYLRNQTQVTLLANNIQLIQEKLTVGELDYLLYDKIAKENIHLEFAIKFYLQMNLKGKTTFLGPSTKDWMKRKLKKLLSHQLQLTKSYCELLPDSVKNIDFTPKVCIKGSLFFHFGEWNPERRDILNEGWWLNVNEMEKLNNDSYSFNLITKKGNWIFPFNKRIERFNFQQLQKKADFLLESRNEIMVVRFNSQGEAIDKGFVVRRNWPL